MIKAHEFKQRIFSYVFIIWFTLVIFIDRFVTNFHVFIWLAFLYLVYFLFLHNAQKTILFRSTQFYEYFVVFLFWLFMLLDRI